MNMNEKRNYIKGVLCEVIHDAERRQEIVESILMLDIEDSPDTLQKVVLGHIIDFFVVPREAVIVSVKICEVL